LCMVALASMQCALGGSIPEQGLDLTKIKFINPALNVEFEPQAGSDPDFEDAIIKGKNATLGQFPYHVVILAMISATNGYLCGGSWISQSTVLTAAHCLDHHRNAPENISAIVEVMKFRALHRPEQIYKAEKTHIHSGFRNVPRLGFPNDIGTIITKRAVVLSANVKILALPTATDAPIGTVTQLAGFGLVDVFLRKIAPFLQYTDLTILHRDVCNSTFRLYPSELQTCIKGVNRSSPCMGDSGGAMITHTADGNFTHQGVVSYGSSYCTGLGVFTRTSKYLSWISEHSDN